MNGKDAVLSLVFRDEESVVGRLRVACDGGSGSECMDNVPEYIDVEGCHGISTVSDDGIDGDTPVQIYTGGDPNISPVLLLEETDYELSLQTEWDVRFPNLIANSGDIALRELHFRGENGESIHLLRFSSYVGKGLFDIGSGERTVSIPFEVRSRKIGYRHEYPLMLSDIAEFSTSLLMSVRSPLHTEYGLSESSETVYEDFLVLDHIFSNVDLLGAYRQIRDRRHSVMTAYTENVPSGMASGIDPSKLPELIAGDNLTPMDDGPIAGRFAPLEVAEGRCREDFDTPENRVVKDTVLTVQRLVHSMIQSGAASGSGYVAGRLLDMRRDIDEIASDPWMNEIGEMRIIPFGSTVLQNRSGYSEMFGIYQMLGMGASFRQEDAEDLLKGQNNKLHRVYEYWCYTRLYRCLNGMSRNKPGFPLTSSNGRWCMTIRGGKGITFEIPVHGITTYVTLHYNRVFSRQGGDLSSYSVALRPDYTLAIRIPDSNGRLFVLNFDAKYKSKPLNESVLNMDEPRADSWEFDICKMHTYRDALLHSCGSYVLYPGTERHVYRKPWNQMYRDVSMNIPSVGAVPLVPGSPKDDQLEKVIREVLESVAGITEGEEMIDDVRDYLF